MRYGGRNERLKSAEDDYDDDENARIARRASFPHHCYRNLRETLERERESFERLVFKNSKRRGKMTKYGGRGTVKAVYRLKYFELRLGSGWHYRNL